MRKVTCHAFLLAWLVFVFGAEACGGADSRGFVWAERATPDDDYETIKRKWSRLGTSESFTLRPFAHLLKTPRPALPEFPEGKRAAIAFTFDDGTVDQYEVALPVLRVYGYLLVPKTASAEKPCPLVVQVPGAGMGGWSLWPHPEKDAALLFMTVFPWAPSDNTGAQNAKYKAFLKDIETREGYHHYYLAGVADGPAQAFYVPVVVGVNRAIDWAAARLEIDA